jgi:hypothetical protein
VPLLPVVSFFSSFFFCKDERAEGQQALTKDKKVYMYGKLSKGLPYHRLNRSRAVWICEMVITICTFYNQGHRVGSIPVTNFTIWNTTSNH